MTDEILFEKFGKDGRKAAVLTKNCVIYTRVSTKEQADNNMSLETQKKACEQFSQKSGYTIQGYFGGTYESAKTDERKEFNRMLQFVKKSREKISYIIVYSVDRFSRSGGNAIYLTEQLKKQGIMVQAVTQPADTTTPSGSLQQNIQFIFSEYDNQLRKEKCMAGVKEALLRGEWCHHPPIGYDTLYANGERKIVVNAQGRLLKKAFLWKANEEMGTEEIRRKLIAMGLKLYPQKLAYILRNPFYCGLMAHDCLEGKLAEGKHERLISKEVFLKVNDIISRRTQGYTVKHENDAIPLKNFLKCDCCHTNMPGYIVRKKGLWYYKCRTKGCGNNKSAKELHTVFEAVLGRIKMDEKYRELIKAQMIRTYKKLNKENEETTAQMNKQLQEAAKKLERLEERFITEEISKDMFMKYQSKFKAEALEIHKKLEKSSTQVSNLDRCVDTVLNYTLNLPEMWASGGYKEKQELQYLVFPKGIYYNKPNNECRTMELRSPFLWIAQLSQASSGNKVGIPELNLSYSNMVDSEGIEPSAHGFALKYFLISKYSRFYAKSMIFSEISRFTDSSKPPQ